ncbi:MAG: hypothetical protein CVU04_03760 [Bacteroidetes bacterium HGW-Bacteroidetes-20]|nr:MAG: hypothetical protein CVU04_03760 [Bacteroidetes bacterium HGW-Bacteroidetes-20]
MRNKTIVVIMFLFLITLVGQAQTRREKTEFIIQKMDLVKVQKKHYQDRISFLKLAVSGKDTIRVIEIENIISEQYIKNELCSIFDTIFNDTEIHDLYLFSQTTTLAKLFFSKSAHTSFYIQSPLDEELIAILNRHIVYEK